MGKLFFWVGCLFLVAVGATLRTTTASEDRKFLLLFLVMSGMFTGMGLMMYLVSKFMKKPEIPDDLRPAVRIFVQVFRYSLLVPIGISLPTLGMLLAMGWITMDYRDYLPWHTAEISGTVQSRESTSLSIGEQALFRYTFTFSDTPEHNTTGTTLSTETFPENAVVPLERCGDLYRIQGGSFGLMTGTEGILLFSWGLLEAVFVLWCASGFLRLGRYLKTDAAPCSFGGK